MGAVFDGAAIGHDDDHIGVADGGEPVGDDDGGPAFAQCRECGLDRGFAFGIECRGGFIEEEDARVAQDGAGEGDALALAAGEALAVYPDAG